MVTKLTDSMSDVGVSKLFILVSLLSIATPPLYCYPSSLLLPLLSIATPPLYLPHSVAPPTLGKNVIEIVHRSHILLHT